MSWSADFIAGLEQRHVHLRWLLEVVVVAGEPSRSWSVGSKRGLGVAEGIAVRGARRRGGTLSPRSWSSTIGNWEVDLVGDRSAFQGHITRGTCCVLKVGLPGMSVASFAQVAVGPFRSMRGANGARFTAEFLDLTAVLRMRWDPDVSDPRLFSEIGGSTQLAADYTAGDTTLEVTSTAQAARETGAAGLVLVTPSSGDPFYVTWTGTAAGPVRLTGVSSTGALGTTAVDAVAGDAVTFVALLADHPISIAQKVCCSRGSGANGSFDTLPQSWGLGIAWALIDQLDTTEHRTQIATSTGTYVWQVVVAEPQEDAWSWLVGLMAQGGFFPAVRQGLLTWRAAQPSVDWRLAPSFAIGDTDIVEVLEYEDYASDLPTEYGQVSAFGAAGSGSSFTETPATLPIESDGLVYSLEGAVDHWADITPETADRLAEAALRVPEYLRLRLATARAAVLTEGDLAWLHVKSIPSRRDGAAGFWGRTAFVTSVEVDWTGWGVVVGLLVYPESGAQYA